MAAKKMSRPANRRDDDRTTRVARGAQKAADIFTAREVKKFGPYIVNNEAQYAKGELSKASRLANSAARKLGSSGAGRISGWSGGGRLGAFGGAFNKFGRK